MIVKPTEAIWDTVQAEYDADYAGFCTEVFDGMERTNPDIADFLYNTVSRTSVKSANGPLIALGSQMALLVYRVLEIASDKCLPIYERASVRDLGEEVFENAEQFFEQNGKRYLEEGYLTLKVVSNFLGDAIGSGKVEDSSMPALLCIPMIMIRMMELQLEKDLAKGPRETH